ncbi:P-loop containing nucleoside triphosphate hydrolase protein [Absidia repens]|uniref:p-loop containing nucleoside triphosphate hydrolase protein n=1 Tax=Absidia repens TaxID=90262 RepID=A0A1X2INX4_9FUNG|nr:P-loop containing nucleoside triphosphate hydrolase protein [Absidia repens]
MGILFSGLWNKLFSKAEVKIIIVGLDNAGKTTLLYKLLMDQVVTTTPTIGSNVEEIQYKNIKFMMWAVIMVIDSTDANRLHIAKQELHQMMESDQLQNSSLLVFANKQDVKGALSAAKISEVLNLTSLKDKQWHIQACSALSGDGLFEGLDWVVLQISGQ